MMKTARKVSKYGVSSGPYFAVFSQNTGKYGSEKTPYLNNFHAVGLYFDLLHITMILQWISLKATWEDRKSSFHNGNNNIYLTTGHFKYELYKK